MKTFSLTVQCETAAELLEAIEHARNCVEEEPQRYDAMEIDESDEMLDEPVTVLFRSA